MNTYTIKYETKAGMYSQYEGIVTVNAENESDAFSRAWQKIKRDCFTGYSRDMFRFTITGITQ